MRLLVICILLLVPSLIHAQTRPDGCPGVKLVGPPAAVKPGEDLVFKLVFPKGFDHSKIRITWNLDRGLLADGQGTPTIVARMDGFRAGTVKATVMLSDGTGTDSCFDRLSATGLVLSTDLNNPVSILTDEPVYDVLFQAIEYASDLTHNNNFNGLIVNSGPPVAIEKQEQLLVYGFRMRQIDLSRFTFARRVTETPLKTILWAVPVTSNSRQRCDDCRMVAAVDIKVDKLAVEKRLENARCPTVKVVGPESAIYPGETSGFTVRLRGGLPKAVIRYQWTIENARIVSGQGTRKVTVWTPVAPNERLIKAKVTVVGFRKACGELSASGTGLINQPSHPFRLADKFQNILWQDASARVESVLTDLDKYREMNLYVVNYGNRGEKMKRARLIRKIIARQKVDNSRVIFVDGGIEPIIRTRLWLVHKDVDPSAIN